MCKVLALARGLGSVVLEWTGGWKVKNVGGFNRRERVQEKLFDYDVATRFEGNRTLWNLHQNLKHQPISSWIGQHNAIAIRNPDDQLLAIDRLGLSIGAR